MSADLETLETAIGHTFAGRSLLVRALTHSSLVNERLLSGGGPLQDNEQLEFLGDAVLGLVISEILFRRFPVIGEGRLSKIKAHFVSASHLYEVARRLGLGAYLQLGRGEEMSGGREKKTLLADALEALIAALYLEGGLEAARLFTERHIIGAEADALGQVEEQLPAGLVDFKSALQELAQARKLPHPRYSIVKERGPEHSKTFTVEVRLGKEWAEQAEGMTKKSAAQKAARQVYERILGGDSGPGGI
ncbi:MAG: ribonuclease III [Bryobacteraceae bacterium]